VIGLGFGTNTLNEVEVFAKTTKTLGTELTVTKVVTMFDAMLGLRCFDGREN